METRKLAFRCEGTNVNARLSGSGGLKCQSVRVFVNKRLPRKLRSAIGTQTTTTTTTVWKISRPRRGITFLGNAETIKFKKNNKKGFSHLEMWTKFSLSRSLARSLLRHTHTHAFYLNLSLTHTHLLRFSLTRTHAPTSSQVSSEVAYKQQQLTWVNELLYACSKRERKNWFLQKTQRSVCTLGEQQQKEHCKSSFFLFVYFGQSK